MRDDFAFFILSHGRAENVLSVNMLREGNYSGEWYIVIDDEDKKGDEYKKNFPGHVKVFNKADYEGKFDAFDNFQNKAAVIYARLASQDMAKEMGLRYLCQLDDDFPRIDYRYLDGNKLRSKRLTNFDRFVDIMLKFKETTNTDMFCIGTQNLVLGGANSKFLSGLQRFGSSMFFLSTDNPIQWCCSVNEDNCTEIRLAQSGGLSFAITSLIVQHRDSGKDGMQSAYSDGRYYHNYARIMLCPSAIHLSSTGKAIMERNKIFPNILNEKWRKENA